MTAKTSVFDEEEKTSLILTLTEMQGNTNFVYFKLMSAYSLYVKALHIFIDYWKEKCHFI